MTDDTSDGIRRRTDVTIADTNGLTVKTNDTDRWDNDKTATMVLVTDPVTMMTDTTSVTDSLSLPVTLVRVHSKDRYRLDYGSISKPPCRSITG
jgi:hypothetical protein